MTSYIEACANRNRITLELHRVGERTEVMIEGPSFSLQFAAEESVFQTIVNFASSAQASIRIGTLGDQRVELRKLEDRYLIRLTNKLEESGGCTLFLVEEDTRSLQEAALKLV